MKTGFLLAWLFSYVPALHITFIPRAKITFLLWTKICDVFQWRYFGIPDWFLCLSSLLETDFTKSASMVDQSWNGHPISSVATRYSRRDSQDVHICSPTRTSQPRTVAPQGFGPGWKKSRRLGFHIYLRNIMFWRCLSRYQSSAVCSRLSVAQRNCPAARKEILSYVIRSNPGDTMSQGREIFFFFPCKDAAEEEINSTMEYV